MCGCLLSTPYWGPGLQPRHVPQLGIKTFGSQPTLNPLSYTSQGMTYVLKDHFGCCVEDGSRDIIWAARAVI